jgi:mono/diheme cytochrome c family protein/thiol-disulfide isomerase/thioredoxin
VSKHRLSVSKTVGLTALAGAIFTVSVAASYVMRDRLASIASADVRGAAGITTTGVQVNAANENKAGELIYRVQCGRCHGSEGHGDGPDAANIKPPPRDFASTLWRAGKTAAAIRIAIVDGIPGTSMTAWGNSLSRKELDAVVEVVQAMTRAELRGNLLAVGIAAHMRGAGLRPALEMPIAPSFVVADLAAKRHPLDEFRGKAVLLVLWGVNCGPCVEELPSLQDLDRQLADEGLVVLPVCVDETDREVIREVTRKLAPDLPVYCDPAGTLKLNFSVQTLPSSILIDRAGHIIGTSEGARPWSSPSMVDLLRDCLSLPSGAETR